MRLPRDISGQRLVKALRSFEYEPTRQTGSHVRLTTELEGTHHVTIPNHDPIRLGTLASILDDIAHHFGLSRDELIKRLEL